ncbi:MAG: response regulator [Alphaproteobacteria bacterium]|nr:response regulator [Alphaproteobacteria bacterium]
MSGPFPETFGPYHLLHRVAVGATAEVFTAVSDDQEPGPPHMVVKRFPAQDTADPPRHFSNEVLVGGLLAHPNLVRKLDDGRVGAHPFITMEWVEGKSLRQLMRKLDRVRHKLPMELAVYIAGEVCKALDQLHRLTDADGRRLELIHRDLSPGNILLGYDGRVKLGDFGDVRPAGHPPAVDSRRPTAQLRYMSPEHAGNEPLTQASDLFSLGAVLHEMLTGRPLFTAGNESVLLTRVRGAQVDPPSLANPDIPDSLDRVVMQALAPFPADRHASVRSLWLALNEYGEWELPEVEQANLARVMQALFDKERKIETRMVADALLVLEQGAPVETPPPLAPPPFTPQPAPPRAAPPQPEPPRAAPPQPAPPAEEPHGHLEEPVKRVAPSRSKRRAGDPPPPTMSQALLNPFRGDALGAVVVPEIPRPGRRREVKPRLAAPPPEPRPEPAPRARPRHPNLAPPANAARPAPTPREPPRAAPPAERPAAPQPPEPDQDGAPSGAGYLLVVDDDRDVCEMFARRFREAGYAVDTAPSGVHAIRMVHEVSYDLVLMAMRMPRPTGIQVLKGIRKTWSPPELPVIMLGAAERSADMMKCLSLGANDFLSKGGDFSLIHARVRTQLMLKLTYEALQLTEARYDALIEASTDLVFHLSPDGRFVYVSSASRDMLGYSPQSLIGRTIYSLIHREDAAGLMEQAEAGEPLPESEGLAFRLRHRDRRYTWVQAHVRITRDRRTNQVTEVHGTCRELPPEMRPDAPTGYVAAARQEM